MKAQNEENLVLYEFSVTTTLMVPVHRELDNKSISREYPMIREGSDKIYGILKDNFDIATNKEGEEKIIIKSQYFYGEKKVHVIAYSGK
jgi:hypothetical protein